jgi:hypothetical protein
MRPPTSEPVSDRERVLLDAYCIDFVFGGVYAWTFLAEAGFSDDLILAVLSAPIESWCHRVGNMELRARRALDGTGVTPVTAITPKVPIEQLFH